MNYHKAEFLCSYGLSSQLPTSDRPEVVFSGRSNVGKSSLINKLCNRKSLARVSATPGKTATINYYGLDSIYLVDLPGYGFARVSHSERERWDDLINSYFGSGERCQLLLQLLDCRHAPSADDMMMMEYLLHHKIPFVVALTKADKLNKTEAVAVSDEFSAICSPYGCKGIYLTSAQKGTGIEELKACIEQYINPETSEPQSEE
ncbi:MAG: ribosome biogenesis GTP-binding protein YihA/YsxC [Pygmaiobacter sp.]